VKTEPTIVHFLLLPDFPLYAVIPAAEALRVANQNAGVALYDWRFVAPKAGAVPASNGMSIEATLPITAGPIAGPMPDCLIVCSGNEPSQHLTRPLLAWLRRLAAHGVVLGAFDTGAFALAAAGVVRDRRITLHWEAIPVFRDAYPAIDVTDQIFVIDRDIVTAAGGVASLDLMVALIGRSYGARLAQVVVNAFILGQPRPAETAQRVDAMPRADDNTIVHRATRLMMEHVAFRLDVEEICARLAIPRRRLERMFLKQTGRSPAASNLDIRLQVAREQLFYSQNPVAHIAEVTGFQSVAHFCRAFRKRFGTSPTAMRRDFRGDQRSRFYPAGIRLLDRSFPGLGAS
jgi:AraC family carnitine catabolism transcriptional activator